MAMAIWKLQKWFWKPLATDIHILVQTTQFCIQFIYKLKTANTVYPHYLPSCFAIFCYSRYWYTKFVICLKSPILQLHIQQNLISRASENLLQVPLHLLTVTHLHLPSKNNDSLFSLSLLYYLTLLILLLQSVSTIAICDPFSAY